MMMCCSLEYFIPLYMYIYVFLTCLCLQTCLAVVDQSVALIKKSKEKFKTSHHIKCPSVVVLLIN